MTPERWEQISEVLEKALSLATAQRERYLNETCAHDSELRREVVSLLASHEQAGSRFLDVPESGSEGRREAAEPSPIRAGRRIGPYDILEEIGRGGMGEVFSAVRADGQYKKKVAIKLVRSGYDTAFILERFRNERQILASLDHPNIARLLDGGTTADGIPYLVMELVEGAPVDSYCDAHKLTVTERLRLFRQVCSAVQYAHQHLVIHRDIKPSNILVTGDGSPKLLDFGIAKILDASGSTEATVFRPMTPEFASPEQIRGEPITTATDVYSLGVVLYQLLTGRSPYRVETRTPAKLAEAITHSEPERPSTSVQRTESVLDGGELRELTPETVSSTREVSPLRLQRRLRGDLDFILLKALRKEPPRRYASVEHFAEDIRNHLEGLPVSARKGTWSYRTGKFVQRHKAGVTAAALVLVTLVAGVVVTVREARIAEANRRRAEARFNDVRKLANSLIFEIHDSIATLPGSTPARKLIVQQSLEYLDGLSRESGGDLSLQRELATAYERVGSVQGNAFQSHLGDPSGALASYRKALVIRQTVAATNSHTIGDLVALARTHRLIGQIQWLSLADTRGALDELRDAVAIAETAARNEPQEVNVLRELAQDYEKLGDIQSGNGPRGGIGDIRAGLEGYRKTLTLLRQIVSLVPPDMESRREIAGASSRIGNDLVKLGDREQALDYYRQAIEILNPLAEASNDTLVRRTLAVCYSRIGDALVMNARPADAVGNFRKQFQLIQPMVDADPRDIDMRTRLILSRASIGNALVEAGQRSEGLPLLMRSLSDAELLAKSASDALDRTILAFIEVWVGEALEKSGDYGGALRYYSLAFQRYSAIIAADPQDLEDKVNVAAVSAHLARTHIKRGEMKEAAEQSRNALAQAESAVSTSPEDMEALYALADSYAGTGEVAVMMARNTTSAEERSRYWNDARGSYQMSLNVWQRIPNPSKIAPNGFEVTDLDDVTRARAQCNLEIGALTISGNKPQ